jgi:hypothetical protein
MIAEFEEKQYELHLNLELLQGSNLLFPPGQVLENILGFDAAIYTRHPRFWTHFARNGAFPPGIKIPKNLWKVLENEIEHFPHFKFNAFIQHKRPEYLTLPRAAEWISWSDPYYRFKIVPHQQEALSQLESSISNKGMVV